MLPINNIIQHQCSVVASLYRNLTRTGAVYPVELQSGTCGCRRKRDVGETKCPRPWKPSQLPLSNHVLSRSSSSNLARGIPRYKNQTHDVFYLAHALRLKQRFRRVSDSRKHNHDVNTFVGNRAMFLRWTFPARLPLRDEEPPRQGKRTTLFERRYRSYGIVVKNEPQTGALHTL
jgi:hypothetical protein